MQLLSCSFQIPRRSISLHTRTSSRDYFLVQIKHMRYMQQGFKRHSSNVHVKEFQSEVAVMNGRFVLNFQGLAILAFATTGKIGFTCTCIYTYTKKLIQLHSTIMCSFAIFSTCSTVRLADRFQ